ncbi:hypothetical protein Lfu02_32010 [Longispora fulva]|uniref:Uncharacterized protein n=1 Tax=Longispora fulva TaxID=619741 RepID=A0A8J7KS83_9ACTN|nr:hypothetical protein [Longispora fulva]MBG6139332.1 hypothetical protein [Longispora fulva]GIG58829.1 hypothetical protein Lfu02_32010 [Longispora fulva]
MSRDGYFARYQGVEYRASPDGPSVRLYTPELLVVAASDVELYYIRTICSWRGQPFIVVGEHGQWLRLEYTGGRAPIAEKLGLEEFDFGVYQGWASRAEVIGLQEQRI